MILQRDDQNATRTLGTIGDSAGVLAQTLELPWNNNAPDASCIPAGTYLCTLRWSPEHAMNLYWITGVPNRADVEIHWGNFPSNTLGCVLVAESRDPDGTDVDNSKTAFARFMAHLAGASSFTLTVADVPQGS
jgi:hypothetical protein